MRGVINTLVLSVAHHTRGAAGQSCILLLFTHSSSGGGEMGQHIPPTLCGDYEQVVLSQRWTACAVH